MKRLFILFVAVLAVTGAKAQQIAVVSEDGLTSVYNTLQKAIEGASDGSVVYLPGGGFPIPDSVKITKRLSIIGIGHKVKGENADATPPFRATCSSTRAATTAQSWALTSPVPSTSATMAMRWTMSWYATAT